MSVLPPQNRPRTPRTPGRLRTATALWLTLGAAMSPALAQTWIAADSSWFTAANWNTATVPLAGGSVFINNGGIARLDTVLSGGATATPALSFLSLGLDNGSGMAVGRITSNGVAIHANSALRAGFGFNGTATFIEGLLGVTGAGATLGAIDIGTLINHTAAAQVRGDVNIDGSVSAQGLMQLGQMFHAPRGSSAEASLRAGDLQGQLGPFWIVGNVTAGTAAQVGNRSLAELVSAGNGTLTLAPGVIPIIGTTFGLDRVTEAGTTYLNQATGKVQLDGTLATAGAQGALLVGRTFGGLVDGHLQVGTLAMGADRFDGVSVGTSAADGVSKGRILATHGDLRHSGALAVGSTTNGRADGAIDLAGGALLGNGSGSARIGFGSGSSGQVVQAIGSVDAGGGFAGHSQYDVGVLSGAVGAGSLASGRLIGLADAGPGSTGNVNVGFLFSPAGSATANGEMRLAGSLGMNGFLQVGQMFGAPAGSSTQGVLQVSGDAGTVQNSFWIVGNVTGNTLDQVGSQSRGEMRVGGGLTLAPSVHTFIGTTFGSDRVVDGLGTRINRAHGEVDIAGALTTSGDQGALLIGRGFGGAVDGSLRIGNLVMGSDRFAGVSVGTSTIGDAMGRLEINGGELRTTSLSVGRASGGSAQGHVHLSHAALLVDSVLAGTGTGHGEITLQDSQAAVAGDFTLEQGLLALERSFLQVGNVFALSGDSTLRLGIGGPARGTEFGAIDTLLAALDGTLELDFNGLDFGAVGGSAVFDLLLATDHIAGDFSHVALLGLANGFQASTGIFSVGDDQIYRLTLARAQVPEPAGLLLVLTALGACAARKRRA